MAPAFSSPKQAGAFALLLGLILLSPVLAVKSVLPSREQLYTSTPRDNVDMSRLGQDILEQKGDIDIAILGSSRLGCALDSGYLQDRLSSQLGRDAVVRSLTWTWNGYDALYFFAKELLEHRKVRMILLCDLTGGAYNTAHRQTSYWFRYSDDADALENLPWISKGSFYASALIGLPRNLVGDLRSNRNSLPSSGIPWSRSPFEFAPEKLATEQDVKVYSEATRADFNFSQEKVMPMQAIFMRRIGNLARQYHCQIAFIHLTDFDERHDPKLNEAIFWPDAFGVDVRMAGIPPAKFFDGMSDEEIGKFYFNPTHFNQNGQKYLTRLITPSLLQIYEDTVKP